MFVEYSMTKRTMFEIVQFYSSFKKLISNGMFIKRMYIIVFIDESLGMFKDICSCVLYKLRLSMAI